MKRAAAAVACAFICSIIAGACERGAATAGAAAETSAAARIGAACAECHVGIAETYRRSEMARALGAIEAGETAGLAPVTETATGYQYQFEASPPALKELYQDVAAAAPLAFRIGAGAADRSYAAEIGGRWWLAPLEILSAGAAGPRRAALAPGHAASPGLRFGVGITEECLGCHTDAPPPRAYPLNSAAAHGAWTPSGIDCAACHANGAAHASFRRAADDASRPGADPMGAPGKLSFIESLSLCARCHLQGDASIPLSPHERGLRPPGGDLLAQRAVFVASPPNDEIGFVSHVERLVESKCFQRAASGPRPMTCVTCHDPHVAARDAGERSRSRGACGKCHAESGAGACAAPPPERGAKICIDCHMRTTPVYDLAGVAIHDHKIERTPPRASAYGGVRVKASHGRGLARFTWGAGAAPAAADDPGLTLMGEAAADRPERAAALVDANPGPVAASLPQYHHFRGVVLERARRFADAEAAYRRAIELDPAGAESKINLSLVLGELGRAADGVALLTALLSVNPAADAALRNRAVLYAKLGDARAMEADLLRSAALAPQAAVARTLSQLAAARGDRASAARWAAEAHRADPRAH